ncbi:MAG: hypothetical protein AAF828_01140 [Bacteroidota bacterium]
MKYLFFLSIMLVAAKGCGDKTPEGIQQAEMGEEITLSVGEALQVKGSETDGFLFVSVEQDSRCPTGVNCIQSGEATIAIEEITGKPRQVKVGTDKRSLGSFTIKGAKVKIMGLDPYPTSGSRIPKESYKLRVMLSPTSAAM